MKIDEAKKILINNKIDHHIYSFGRPKMTECVVIEQCESTWIIYNWEKGQKKSIKYYKDEDLAVKMFVKKVIRIASLNEGKDIILR